MSNAWMRNGGYYVIEPTELDGTSRGRFGPYTIAEAREFLRGMPHITHQDAEHAIAVTQHSPGVAFVLSGTREVKLPGPNGIRTEEVIAWTCELTWHLRKDAAN